MLSHIPDEIPEKHRIVGCRDIIEGRRLNRDLRLFHVKPHM